MSWKKVENDFAVDMWNFEQNAELEGKFLRKEENVGPNNSNVYYFEVGEEEVGVWGSSVLDSRLAEVKENQKVKIVSLGKAQSKRGTSYNNFDVFLWTEEIPF